MLGKYVFNQSGYAITMVLLLVSTMGRADDEALVERGLNVYKKANCVGCHKWHGGGGGGYGGAARSLRESGLDAANLKILIECGRPGTGMPFHKRGAYKGDNTDCYGATAEQLGDSVPPRARSFIRDPEIDAVVAYVQAKITGKAEPNLSECVEFWGEGARECSQYE